MNAINLVLGVPLGYLMYFCYLLCGSYGVAIILFTLASKVILFPLSLVVQKNSIKMVKMQPMLDEISSRYAGDKDKIAEEQLALYKREKYSPAMGCLPTLLQLPLILGLLNVIYNPLQHLLHLPQNAIAGLTDATVRVLGTAELGWGAQLKIIDAVHASPAAFAGFEEWLPAIQNLDLVFCGIDLSQVPTLAFNALLWIPVLAMLSTLVMCVAQNYMNVLQRTQSALSQWGMAIFLTAFSTWFTFLVPAGVGLYWIAGNLSSILVMQLCNMVYNPRKLIDMQNHAQKQKLTRAEKAALNAKKKENRAREKADSKRFYAEANDGKQLVFYSAGGGFYKYFSRLIDYILAHSDLSIHYVTSDERDAVFEKNNPRILPYYIGEKALIPFMMKMDADMVVMTMPDLGQYHIKRSLVKKDVEYIYLDHGMTSFHLMLREGALDNYDTIFCYGPNHIEEIRETERVYGLPAKTLVKTGYGLLDTLLEQVAALGGAENQPKRVLIAPSWQQDNIMELCLDGVLDPLLDKNLCVILRPHPEFIKRFPAKMQAVLDKYGPRTGDNFIIETDFASNTSVFTADVVITDWSSIAQEFSYATKKPSLFINTPMKVMNPEYTLIPLVPLDISLRDEIGVSVDVDKLDGLYAVVAEMLQSPGAWREKITGVLNTNIYDVGDGGRGGGEYIIAKMKEAKARHEAEEAGE